MVQYDKLKVDCHIDLRALRHHYSGQPELELATGSCFTQSVNWVGQLVCLPPKTSGDRVTKTAFGNHEVIRCVVCQTLGKLTASVRSWAVFAR